MGRKKDEDLIPVGFWSQTPQSADQEHLPWPGDWIDWSKDAEIRQLLIDYLDGQQSKTQVVNHYKGLSNCRLCNKKNGSTDVTDGVFVWPSGLPHYLKEHGVALPKKFVQHVIQRTGYKRKVKMDTMTFKAPPDLLRRVRQLSKRLGIKTPDRVVRDALRFYLKSLRAAALSQED